MAIDNSIWKGNNSVEVTKQKSLDVMRHHANNQIKSLKEQADVLINQAEEIQDRVRLSYLIASAEYAFTPVILNEYCLYEKENGTLILTLIKPSEWNSLDKTFIATVRKLGDSTWEKVEESDSSVGRDNPSSITIDGTYTL